MDIFSTEEQARIEEQTRKALDFFERSTDDTALEDWFDDHGQLSWSVDLPAF
jgi:hypothetical protein